MKIEINKGTRVDLFRSLADDVTAELMQQAQTRTIAPGVLIFGAGSPGRVLHVLTSGCVKIMQTTPRGERVITRYVKPGEAFGMSAVLGEPYRADAVAVTSCIGLQWPSNLIRDTILRQPGAALDAMRSLDARLGEMEARLLGLSSGRVEQRIAHALAALAEKFGRSGPHGIEISIPLRHQDLADLAGTTLHTVSRTLGKLESQCQIRRGRCRIVITNLAGLLRLAAASTSSDSRPRRGHRRVGGRSR
ncbi:Crp/Fnr family transcriptional regulator [Microvirga sp. CF3016]|uniref:Crp/Fnr family transcriptional regulator n=1 Tax=Microvirga sp. CF3016 TaxID=3110181 RepID=UPI002E7948F3|nr:Crp/Fnr family transcriptional regulator [Microvirga sp. CF3016]MEE1609820.1 Crp/Fnr family transcriptional regulator [Microvirga sp. CF3016]